MSALVRNREHLQEKFVSEIKTKLPAVIIVEDKRLVSDWLASLRAAGINAVGLHDKNKEQVLSKGLNKKTAYVSTFGFVFSSSLALSEFEIIAVEMDSSTTKPFDVFRDSVLSKISVTKGVVLDNPWSLALADKAFEKIKQEKKAGALKAKAEMEIVAAAKKSKNVRRAKV